MGGRICIFGDSVTLGAYDLEKGGWVNRLWVYSENDLDDITVYNSGISGDNTELLLERFDFECKVREPKVIIFSIGINDAMYINDKSNPLVSLEKFNENLNKLVNQAKVYSQKIILMGIYEVEESKTTPIPWETTIFFKNENVEEYDEVIRNIAFENNLIYVKLSDLIKTTDLYDGLHPNAKGHEKIFQKVKSVLIENKYVC